MAIATTKMPSRDHFMTEKERKKRDSAEAGLMLDWLRSKEKDKEDHKNGAIVD